MKVLGHGDLDVKLSVSAHAFSKSAVEKIEAAGGSVTWLKPPHEPKKRRHKKATPARRARGRPPSRPRARRQPSRPSLSRRIHRGDRRELVDALLARQRLAGAELRRRLLFTAFVLALYRLGSFIPAPGVDSTAIKDYFGNQGGTVLGLLNLFSGNALSRFSIFALGIMPYITASIILQLDAVVVPTLAQLQKEGEAGYAKINQYTRYLTVCLAAAQAVGYSYLFRRQGILDGEHRPPRPDHRHPHRRRRRC